jgi:4-hydroxy-2-oxoheptanedioate aldolase
MTHESLERAWANGGTAVGGWVTSGADFSLELYRRLGYDYVGIDCQHSALGEPTAAAMIHRTPAGSPATIVRVSKNDSSLIGRLIDAGADGIIVPMVSTAEEAEAAVAAVRYPPAGVRSYGPTRADLPSGDLESLVERVSVFLMIETAEGLANVDLIARVPGVAGVYIGPADLSIGLGLDAMSGFGTDQLVDPVESILRSCHAAGIVVGMHQANAASAVAWIRRGVRLVSLGSDKSHFVKGATAELETVRGVVATAPAEATRTTSYV